ncbi:TPA: RAMP superfamily CRISPR-associated protein [Bacillus paranthracis]
MKRNRYKVKLRTNSPLLLPNQPSGGESTMFQSLNYILGSAVRGAAIQRWGEMNGFIDEETFTKEIYEKFHENGIHFSNFYPNGATILPLTAETCKQFPGFRDTTEDAHGVKDMLLRHYEVSKTGDFSALSCCHDDEETGEICNSLLKSYEGLYKSESRELVQVGKIQSGHVSIDPITQTNQKGQLFFEDAIEIGEEFIGFITVPEQLESVFAQIFTQQNHLRLGAKRTSGYGEMTIEDVDVTTDKVADGYFSELNEPLHERYERLNEAAKELGVIQEGQSIFAITLLSDAIFVDKYFRYTSELTGELLTDLTGIQFEGLELVHSQAAIKRISGWNQKWKVAIDDEVAVRMGSTYLYTINEELLDLEKLAQLENCCIGERTWEGYGELIVSHPFHKQWKEV